MARNQKTSFNICSVSVAKYGSAYTHQKPEHRATLNYIHSDRTQLNESWHKEYQANGHPKTLRNYLADTKKVVKAKTGRAMQKKAEDNVIGEAVVVIDEQTTMEDLQKLGKAMEQRYGWTCVQIHIHRDEGYLGERTEEMKHREGKYNLHAHMFFITTNLATGKSWKRQRGEGSVMQDITAQTLDLTRGVKKSEQAVAPKETLHVLEYKAMQEEIRLQTLKDKIAQEQEQREQARAEAKQATIDTAEQIIARNQRPIIGPKWRDVAEQVIEDYERILAQKKEQDKLMKELGLDDDAFKSFWGECKDWFRDWGERLKDLALWIWGSPRGVIVEDVRYTADRERGKLLLDGQTLEQVRAPKIVVPTSNIQRQAQAVRERNAGQSRDTDRRREQELAQERRERRGRKL
jgi:hypothetical protein